MVDAALGHIRILEDLDFDTIKISLKAFDVPTTVAAYRLMATKVNYPFHLGITEAGLTESGSIRSAVGLGILLNEGLGDTMRVSLTDHPRRGSARRLRDSQGAQPARHDTHAHFLPHLRAHRG